MKRRVVGAAVLVTAALAIAPPAAAVFTSSSSASSATFTAATLGPAGNLTLTWLCSKGIRTAQLTWTASPSPFAQGYLVERVTPNPTSVTVTATSYTDPTRYTRPTAVEYSVTTVSYNWRSSPITAAGTSPTGKC